MEDARRLSRRERQHAHRRGAALGRRRARRLVAARSRAADHLARGARPGARRTTGGSPSTSTPSWTPLLEYNVDEPAHPFRPYGATIGHWLEWSRLALHLRAGLGSMLRRAGCSPTPSRCSTPSVREGWAVDGADGFVYTVDWAGRPVVRERMHWVVAEGTATAAALHQVTGESSYADWYATWWQHIDTHFRDPDLGSWHHELAPDLTPSSVTWPGKPDTYHAFQATLHPPPPAGPDPREGPGRRPPLRSPRPPGGRAASGESRPRR